jgi:rhamnosyltransferase
VTFNPGPDLLARVDAIARQVSNVVIVDNGSAKICASQLDQLSDQPGIHLILNCENEGIAHALNQGASWAAGRGYAWILTLDQDTVVAEDMVDSLVEAYRASLSQAELAVIGSNFRSSRSAKPFYEFVDSRDVLAKEVKTVITSGSLISLHAFHLIGGFRDEFFIDGVDLEYCLRARIHGLRVMMVCKPLMEHPIGRLSEHRLPWKKTGTTNHPAWRHYFMTRNIVILAREYIWKEPGLVLATLWARTKSILLVALFEEERIPKIWSSILGGLDGIRGRTDRFRAPNSRSQQSHT